jgi:hypothetical protein
VLLGVAHKGAWGDRVTVTVHHRPESEELERGYEEVTMTGVLTVSSLAAIRTPPRLS